MLSVHNTHNLQFVTRNIAMNSGTQAKAMEKLASGFKINTGADDPAGLTMSEKLRAQIEGLERALANTNDSDNIMGIMEGGLGQVQSVLQDLQKLAIGAANSGVVSQEIIAEYQAQMDCGLQAIDRIMNSTTYGGRKLLDNVLEKNQGSLSGNSEIDAIMGGKITDKAEITKKLEELLADRGNFIIEEEADPDNPRASSINVTLLNPTGEGEAAAGEAGAEEGSVFSKLSKSDQAMAELAKTLLNLGDTLGSTLKVTGVGKDGETTYSNLTLQDLYSGGAASLDRDPAMAMKVLEEAHANVLATRVQIGATQAMRVHERGAMESQLENLTRMESGLRDTEVANTMQEFWKSGLLMETGMKMYEAIRAEQEGITNLLDTLA